jgi:tripartite-type tricarboxylate transporter receptor subunit TctC
MHAGRVRALATTGSQRNPSLPELPTIAETVPGYEISQSWGIVVPAGISGQIANRLNSEIAKVMKSSEVSDRVLKTGAVPAGDSSSDFAAYMTRERRRLGEVIAKTGIVLAD